MAIPADPAADPEAQRPLEPPRIEEVEQAAALLAPILTRVPPLAFHRDASLLLKSELVQPTGSFKIRGVFHAVARLDAARRAAGLRTVSAGNTAKALAWCGRHFGVTASSLMPEHAPRTKVQAVEALGGVAELVPTAEVFRFLRERAWEREPQAFIHPWIERDVMIGHGTLGLEMLEDCADVDTVLIPVGGGGLCAGVATVLKALKPSLRIVAVEPVGCAAWSTSLERGVPSSVECVTRCDGVAVPYVTEEMFPILRGVVDDCVLVEEEQVEQAIRELATGNHMVVEGAGALAVAAATAMPESERGRTLVPITGGSIDAPALARILLGG